jgi:cytochrome c oxidase subunit 3
VRLFLLASGAVLMDEQVAAGPYIVLAGFAVLLFMLFGWFGRVIDESEGGSVTTSRSIVSFRWGMSWFIFSEVMFFAAFFGALFYIRVLSVPDLASAEQQLLWPDFKANWPSAGTEVRRAVFADGRDGDSAHQYPAAAVFRGDPDLGALGPGCRKRGS